MLLYVLLRGKCRAINKLTVPTHGFGLQRKAFGINLTFISIAIKPRWQQKKRHRLNTFDIQYLGELGSWKEKTTKAVFTLKWIWSKKKKI